MRSTKRNWFLAQPVGVVERPDGIAEGGVEQNTPAIIRVRPEWVDQLTGLEGFSHLVVVGWLDRAERREPGAGLMRPEGREDIPEVGAFATRTPRRPNPIGLCYPAVERIEGAAVHVRGLDFWAGTPIIDIKGYFPRDEMKAEATVPEWLTRLWLGHDVERAGDLPDAIDVVETVRGAVTFRRGAMADVPAALAYINALSREQTYILMQGEQLTLAEELAFFSELMSKVASGDAVQIVAMAGDELVGIAQTDREPRVFAHVARLGISIAHEWREMGLGRRLMEILLAETERTMPGIEAIQLECFGSNTAAIGLYESVGFRECGRIPNKIRHRGELVDEVIMTRPI